MKRPPLFARLLPGAVPLALAVLIASLPGALEGGGFGRPELVLPQGDPAAGRQTFLDLSCTSCHTVSGEEGFPVPVSSNPGPELGPAHGRLHLGELVTAIVSPSHEVPPAVLDRSGGSLSPMGDFSEAMTVRQLIDLVTFLRSIEP